MHTLFSSRLQLLALDLTYLQLLHQDERSLLKELRLHPSPIEVHPADFMQAFDEALVHVVIPQVSRRPVDYRWFTHWLIIHRQERRRIGGIGFSGFPNKPGETMTGYFIDRRYEGRGYASEALRCLLDWAAPEPSLQAVIATIPVGHHASERVLLKNGFREDGEAEPGINRWRLILSE
jgi:RimJ/RimL family protein N-acetyltransferase